MYTFSIVAKPACYNTKVENAIVFSFISHKFVAKNPIFGKNYISGQRSKDMHDQQKYVFRFL